MGPFDEMAGLGKVSRAAYGEIESWLDGLSVEELEQKSREAELLFRRIGITFAVYGEGGDPERIIPFDIVPRVLSGDEWARLERVRRIKRDPLLWIEGEVCPWPEKPTLEGYRQRYRWHRHPATGPQYNYLRDLGFKAARPLTKGEASWLIERAKEYDATFRQVA